METFMNLTEFVMWFIRGGLVGVVLFLPFIIPFIGWILFTNKYTEELQDLRENGDYKWRKTTLSLLFEDVYVLSIGDYFKEYNKRMYWIRWFVIAILTILFTFCLCDTFQSRTEYNSYERELYAFEDNQGFYLRGRLMGSGSGSDELVYYYTLKSGDESFQSYRATANMSEIHYTNSNPYVKYTNSWDNFLDDKWHSKVTRILLPKDTSKYQTLVKIDFYVPNGSVQNNYNSDLQ